MATLQIHVTKRNTVSVQEALFRMGYRWCGSVVTVILEDESNWIVIDSDDMDMLLDLDNDCPIPNIPIFIVPEEVVDEQDA